MTGAPPLEVLGLYRAMQRFVAAHPALAAFAGEGGAAALAGTLPYSAAPAETLPAVAALPTMQRQANAETAPLVDAIIEAAPHLRWRQSYTAAEVGAEFLANYAWFDLISPDGPFLSPDLRLAVGYWGHGLSYPRDSHEPSEIYCTLAGAARYWSDDRPAERHGPGGTFVNRAWIDHGAEMDEAPLLAMAIWRGDNLTSPPRLGEARA